MYTEVKSSKFWNDYKHIILFLIFLILGNALFFTGCTMERSGWKEVNVPGTVYGKSEGYATRYKSSSVYSEFWMAVHPDDSRKYNDYDVKVAFSTFARFEKGDHIAFNVPIREVDRNYKEPNGVLTFTLMVLGAILIGTAFTILLEHLLY